MSKETQEEKIKKLIGRSEQVKFPNVFDARIPAKIDTGAKTSAIWASDIEETEEGLSFALLGPKNHLYTGEKIVIPHFRKVIVASSIGEPQERYLIQLTVVVKGKKIRSRFTLTDRSTQAYPILLGRNVLRGKFIVDVTSGRPHYKAERERSQVLQARLKQEATSS